MIQFDPNVVCECGKVHKTDLENCLIKSGAINDIPKFVKMYNATKAYIIGDINTYPIAGDKIAAILAEAGIPSSKHIFPDRRLEPDERAVGSLLMAYDASCDIIIAIGSGVINDISKILAHRTNHPYIIVASAAYMDGYASATSSMALAGVKVTVKAKAPEVIIGDLDILSGAPVHMAKAGLGDMLAKYIAICEWRISNLINGEYYCEQVAQFTRESLKACVDRAPGLLTRNADSMDALFNGLINCGKSMDYAGASRPAAGVEHYFSHIWDMRGLEFGTPVSSHGVQCALGTLYAIKAYEALKKVVPDKQKALDYAASFDFEDWGRQLTEFVGKGAEPMIALEAKEHKYDVENHKKRIEVIVDKWDEILKIIDEELPTLSEFEAILDSFEAPKSLSEVGMDDSNLGMVLKCTKDIRDKYILSRLIWDLGIIDEFCDEVFGK